jgi:hypothetical protein
MKNKEQVNIGKSCDLGVEANLLSYYDWFSHPGPPSSSSVLSSANWRIAFSRVGFSRKKDQALMEVTFKRRSDDKYSFGFYYLLKKAGTKWVVRQKTKAWEY